MSDDAGSVLASDANDCSSKTISADDDDAVAWGSTSIGSPASVSKPVFTSPVTESPCSPSSASACPCLSIACCSVTAASDVAVSTAGSTACSTMMNCCRSDCNSRKYYNSENTDPTNIVTYSTLLCQCQHEQIKEDLRISREVCRKGAHPLWMLMVRPD